MERAWIKSLMLEGALILLFSSCSVKEDRSPCPCLLTVDLSRTLNESITPPALWDRGMSLVLYDSGGSEILKSGYEFESARQTYEYAVPRGDVSISGVMGLKDGFIAGGNYLLPVGKESDRLYVSSGLADCCGEEALFMLEMYKQFSEITVTGLDSFEMRLEATAGSNVLDLKSRKAVPGRFRFDLLADDEGVCRFRLPRQVEDDLQIIMYDADGRLNNSIPLGKYLTDTGFDWDALSLDDVTVNVDRVTVSVSIAISGWSNIYEFPYTI